MAIFCTYYIAMHSGQTMGTVIFSSFLLRKLLNGDFRKLYFLLLLHTIIQQNLFIKHITVSLCMVVLWKIRCQIAIMEKEMRAFVKSRFASWLDFGPVEPLGHKQGAVSIFKEMFSEIVCFRGKKNSIWFNMKSMSRLDHKKMKVSQKNLVQACIFPSTPTWLGFWRRHVTPERGKNER